MLNYSANGPSGYNLTNSLRFRRTNSAYLSRTPASATNRKTWTWSGWVKRGTLTSSTTQGLFLGNPDYNDNSTYFGFTGDQFFFFNRLLTVANGNIYTTALYRDPSAWYHVVVAMDTTQATAANRFKLYINGIQVTSFAIETYPTQNTDMYINSTSQQIIGFRRDGVSTYDYFDGYLTEVNFVDGQQLTPSSFGNTNSVTGVWQPAKYTGTYGNNGFYLNFNSIALTSGSNTGLGKDNSGNGNYWNTNNISVTAGVTYDAMTDVPTLTSATVANYCVKNPLVAGTGATITGANLNATGSTTTFANARSTFTLSSGKWYWEETITGSSIYDVCVGLVLESSIKLASNTRQTGWYNIGNAGPGQISSTTNGGAFVNISTTDFATNDVLMIAYDAGTGYIWFGKNGTWYPATTGGTAGNPAAGTNQTITAVSELIPSSFHYNTNSGTASNFGQRPFSYTPPTGFVALNTFNLPSSTIPQGNKYMDATTYTGNGSTQTITNTASFKPDLVWQKPRSEVASHRLVDSVRGVNKVLYSNQTAAEATETNTLTSFNSNGFTGGGSNAVTSGNTAVAWQWQAGQGSTSSNTSGTITSTVSANTTAGFSILTYTGNATANATVGHGLGVTPAMIIIKAKTSVGVESWCVWQQKLGASNYFLRLDTTDAVFTSYTNRITAQSSTTFTLGSSSNTETNGSGYTYVAYCWAEIAGFSKFGSYTGNGSTDGPFVYTGFRPKYVVIKRTDGAGAWYVLDSVRNTYNVMNSYIELQDTAAEGTFTFWDFLSNGFKLRQNASAINGSGQSFIYMAFAENPFKNALAR